MFCDLAVNQVSPQNLVYLPRLPEWVDTVEKLLVIASEP
jgi:hypothetical protein